MRFGVVNGRIAGRKNRLCNNEINDSTLHMTLTMAFVPFKRASRELHFCCIASLLTGVAVPEIFVGSFMSISIRQTGGAESEWWFPIHRVKGLLRFLDDDI